MRIQIIGLPGTGKTTGIRNYFKTQKEARDRPLYIDIRNFVGVRREAKFAQAIKSYAEVIAESACGVPASSYVIKLQTPIRTVYQRLLERDKHLDEDLLSLYSMQMIRADYTLSTEEDLPSVLSFLFKDGKVPCPSSVSGSYHHS